MQEAVSTHQEQNRVKNVLVGEVFDGSTVYRPLKAIRLKCLDCCGGSSKEVRECGLRGCSLWPYRLGHRPKEA